MAPAHAQPSGAQFLPRRLAFVALVVGLAVALMTIRPQAAAAHASLTESAPVDGTALTGDTVTLRFSEGVRPARGAFNLYNSAGDSTAVEPTTANGRREVRIKVGSDLAAGWYSLTWRIVSDDSHPVAGTLTFSVGEPQGAAPTIDTAVSKSAPAAVGLTFGLVRAAGFAGLLAYVGGIAICALLWPAGFASKRARRWIWSAWTVALVATLASVGLQGAYTEGRGLTSIFDGDVVAEVLRQKFGALALVRVACLLLGAFLAVSLRPKPGARLGPIIAALVVGVSACATVSWAGHASQGRWSTAALVLDSVHLLAASVWLGGLSLLWIALLPRRSGVDTATAWQVMGKFSVVAFVGVGSLAATGVFAAVRQSGGLQSLIDTDYGHALLVKIALVLLILVAAIQSRRALQRRALTPTSALSDNGVGQAHSDLSTELAPVPDAPAATAGTPNGADTRRALRRWVGAELAGGLLVVAVTAWLVVSPPAREVFRTSDPELITLRSDDMRVDIILDPARRGTNVLHLTALSARGLPRRTEELTATLTKGEVELKPKFVAAGPGHVIAPALVLPSAGTWRIEVRVVTDEVDSTVLDGTITVGN